MALHRLEITSTTSYANGRSFGEAGTYQRLDGIAHYRVDPNEAANARIVDLANARTEPDGLVHFSGDVTLLVPADRRKASGAVLVEVPNRGNRIALRTLNMASVEFSATANIDPGDGFLMERGWCVAWCGWQWDVPRSRERIGLEAPLVDPAKLGADQQMQLRIQPDLPRRSLALTDQHVGAIGHHQLIEAGDIDEAGARLLVRRRLCDEPTELARDQWRFAKDEKGVAVPDAGHVWLEGGFKAGLIYDVLYTPARCPVVGAGMLAVRDFGAYLRNDPEAPTAGIGKHFIVEGQSQCGRFLRTFLYTGLNQDEHGKPVFDGVLAHIAGARRGEFNHRYAQPSVQPTLSYGHLFPFTDAPQTDPISAREEGLLDRQAAAGAMPKIIYTDTSAEYHRGDAALTHLALDGNGAASDLALPDNVRRYLFASTMHGPGALPFARLSVFGTRAANDFNIVDYRPLYRAALMNLLTWIADGTEPPPSVVPRIDDGTAARRADVLRQCAGFPGFSSPDPACLPYMWPLDLGPGQAEGTPTLPARIVGEPYPDWVSAIDEDGNETGGIRMPDVSVPVATHTGFNTRDPRTGGEGHYLEYVGSSLPFARNETEREATGDARPSIESRYSTREAYLAQVRAAAEALVSARHLCREDVPVCERLAAERYDGCTRPRDG